MSAGASGDRISRNAGFAFVTQMTTAALTAGLTIFLGRALTPNAYGYFAFALSVVAVAILLADLGIAASASRYLAERRTDPEAVADVFTVALRLKLIAGGVVSVALIALAAPISQAFGTPGATWPLRGVAVSLAGQSLFLLLLGSFEALAKIRHNLPIVTAESVIEVTASVGLVLLGGGATGAAFGRAIGYVVGSVLALVVARRVIGRLRTRRDRPPAVAASRILLYAGPLLLVDAVFRVFSSIDVLLIAAILGGGATVAMFELPMRLVWFLHYPVGSVASAIAPRLASESGQERDVKSFMTALRYVTMLQVLFVPPVVIWAEPIITLLFGTKYPEAPAVLRALAPFVLLSGPAALVTLGVNYVGEGGKRIAIAVVTLAVNVTVDVTLLPRIGVVAGGWGTSLAYVVWVPAHLWILRRALDLSLRPLWITLARAGLGGAVMAAILFAFGTHDVALWQLVVGILAGSAAYVAVLRLTGEVGGEDIDVARGMLRRRVAA